MHSRIMVVRKAHALSVAVRIGTVRLSCYHLQHKAEMWCKAIVMHKNQNLSGNSCCTWTQSTRWRVDHDIQSLHLL
jgi:hypothetical protein